MSKSDDMQIDSKDPAYDTLVGDIAAALRGVQELCRRHGIFDGLRELFNCPQCGEIVRVEEGGR